MKNKPNSLLAAMALGREAIWSAVSVLAGNPPSLSAVVVSAVLGYVAQVLHGRPALSSALRLE